MKKAVKYLIAFLLVLSLSANGLMLYYIKETEKPHPSISKITFGEHNTVVYCEKTADVQAFRVDSAEKSFQFGDSKLVESDNLYLITSGGKINLSDYDAKGFVIDSEGNILYSLAEPSLKKEKVFVTPSGHKYHTDIYCAGKNGFEVDCETALAFDRRPCKNCSELK